MIKRVETGEEFTALLPALVYALRENESEWNYENSLQDMLEMMLGNLSTLYYEGNLPHPTEIGFLIVNKFTTGNVQIDLMWSWARGNLQVSGILQAAQELAIIHGARRMKVNACRHLAKQLIQHGFKASHIGMVKEV